MQQSDDNSLTTILLTFAPLSLTAFGGGVSAISAIQHQVVDVHQWTTGAEFLSFFAISRAAPGPGSMMLATLIGLKAAGLPGAIVATLAMFLPTSILCIATAALWRRYRSHTFVVTLEMALIPIGAGLVMAAVWSLGELASTSWTLLAITMGSALTCITFPAIHPLYLIALGTLINVAVVLLA